MIEVREGVSSSVIDRLAPAIAAQKTLEDVVRWGLALAPPRLVERVVVQDEYTHDVVLGFSDDVYLVYDTT